MLAAHVKSIVEAPSLRSNPRDEFHCPCENCQRASHRGKFIPKSQFFPDEDKKKRGRPSDEPKPDLTPIKTCPKCKCEIGPGKPHPCSEKSKTQHYLDTISPKSKASIAHHYVKEALAEAKEKKDELVASLQSKVGGRPLNVVAQRDIKERTVKISKKDLDRFRLEMDISKTKTLKAARYFAEITGSKLEEYMQEYIFKEETVLSDFFDVKEMTCEGYERNPAKDSEPVPTKRTLTTVKRNVVYCTDLEAFIIFLMKERALDENSIIKIGIGT